MATIIMIDDDARRFKTEQKTMGKKWEIKHEDYHRWMWFPNEADVNTDKPSLLDGRKGIATHKCRFVGFDYEEIAKSIRVAGDMFGMYHQAPGEIVQEFHNHFFRPAIKSAEWFAYHEVAFGRKKVPEAEKYKISSFSKVEWLLDFIDIDPTSGTSYQYPDHKLAGVFCIDEGQTVIHNIADSNGHVLLSHPDGIPCRHNEIWKDGDVPITPHTGQLYLWPADTIFHYINRDESKVWAQVLIS